MIFSLNLIGGGWLQVRLDADDLHEVSEQLRRERSLIGQLITIDSDCPGSRVLIPVQRIAMVSEA